MPTPTSHPARRSRIRRPLAALVATLVVAGMLGVVAIAPAGARVPTKSLCDTIQDGDVGAPAPPQSTASTAADAKKSLKLYKKFAKSDAPKAVKKALATIVSTLKELASGTPPTELGFGVDVDATAVRQGFGEGLHVRPRQVRRRRHRGPPRRRRHPGPAVARTVDG